jgi:hypothetical protein
LFFFFINRNLQPSSQNPNPETSSPSLPLPSEEGTTQQFWGDIFELKMAHAAVTILSFQSLSF